VGVFGGCDAFARLAAAQFYLRGCNATQLGRFTLCQTRQFRATNTGARDAAQSIDSRYVVVTLSNKHPLMSGGYGPLVGRSAPAPSSSPSVHRAPSFPSVAVSLRRHTGHESLVLSHSRMHDSP